MSISKTVYTRKGAGAEEPRLVLETAEQLKIWNATWQPYPQGVCVPDLVSARAAATPDALALEVGGKVLTYGDLNSLSNRVARRLQTLGVGADVLVGLYAERSVEMVVGALGILKAGGAYVPLDPAYPRERLAFMLNDAQAPVLLTRRHLAGQLPSGAYQVVTLDVENPEIKDLSPLLPDIEIKAEQLAYVIYTSGSTGQPKGVEITHSSLLNLVFWHQHAFAVSSADRATQLASPGFDAAVWELWPYLTAGASVHLSDEPTRVSAGPLRDWLIAKGITISFVSTPLAEQLMVLEWPAKTSLRILLTGADMLHHYPARHLSFKLVNNYGPTECTVVATSGVVPAGEDPDTAPSIGRPIANVQVYILDEDLNQVPMGVPGELHIGGAGLARGYHNLPTQTAEKFIPNPFSAVAGARLYKTGDQARYLPDGQIEFLGRIDEQIKIRGFRIEPNEIVAVLDSDPSVGSSIVVAREEAPGDKRLVAYIAPAPGAELSEQKLRGLLRKHLPDYMVPSAFVSLASLPLTANGKIDRSALPAPAGSNTLRDMAIVAPTGAVEKRLAGILGVLLGVEQVGVNDNFFLLGGHSLLGTQLIARVRQAFGVELTLRGLFDNPTVAGISAEIERLILVKLESLGEDEVQQIVE